MALLTRCRAAADGMHVELAVTYYSQRASAGLIVTEAMQISPMGKGYMNTPGIRSPEHLPVPHVTPADEQDRSRIKQLADDVREATGDSVGPAFVDHGYNGEKPAATAAEKGIELSVVRLPEAKTEFVLLPRRRMDERSFGWTARFRRPVRDYERLATMLAGLHFAAFAIVMLRRPMTGIG